MGNDTFYRDTFVLTISNLTMAVIRFIFSIILSEKLGPEGVGLYGLIMPIYDLFCCLVCGGIVAAISKEVSSYHGTGSYTNLNKSVRYNFIFLLLWSIFITIIMFISSPFISKYIIKDSRTLYSLWILCPAIVFISLSSILKGYFFGVMEVNTPAIIDIVEKALRLFITLSLIDFLLLKDITTTVTATYASFTIGEFVSFVLLYIFFKKSSKKFHKNKLKNDINSENGAQLLYNSLKVAFPLAVNGFLTTAITSASTLLVPRRLIASGMTYNMALESIGKFSGMALTIIFFPLVIVNSMATILVPDISQNLTKKDYRSISLRVNEVIKMCFILGVSVMIICFIIPNNLGLLFYKRDDLSSFIKSIAISVPFLYASSCTYGILNGLGKQKKILVNSILTSVIELVIMYFLMAIPKINIYGFAIALFVSSILGFLLNLIEINRTVKLYTNIYEILIITSLSLICIFIIKILNVIIPNNNFLIKNIILLVVSIALFFASFITIRKTSNNSNGYY